jgi:predicted transcriptional regulator
MYSLQKKTRKIGKKEKREKMMPDAAAACMPDLKGPHRPFTEEEEKEREKERVRQLEPILDELEEWRKNSLSASFRV